MPIYAYCCQACGFTKDVLQKISDAPLTDCPSCQQGVFKKQLTAAGFQLKGSGWYVTDFRGGAGATKASAGEESSTASVAGGAAETMSASTDSTTTASSASAPVT